MQNVNFPLSSDVLIGADSADDAGVFRISDELALIQTVDFFTPIVDDPYDFGRIAAANSLSDVYAMGGTPKTAMNIVAYPIELFGPSVLQEILAGGADKVREAEAVLLGGHSVEDKELKYGLSVTGFVHPGKITANQGLRHGDCLILTKPLGTGIVNTAIKAGLASNSTVKRVTELMATLNKKAAAIMLNYNISACTDVTGFGLLGHLAEMVSRTKLAISIQTDAVPILVEAKEFGSMGFVPVGAYKNRTFRQDMVVAEDNFDPVMRDILFDPQTSGGLLIGCREQDAEKLENHLQSEGMEAARIIGTVADSHNTSIHLQ